MENGDYFEGQEVEVTTEDDEEEEGSKDSWYTAKIVKLPNRKAKKRILVRFENGLNQLRTVDPAYMRPLPPQLPVQSYRLHQIVDALHKDWWLKGIITKDINREPIQADVREPDQHRPKPRKKLKNVKATKESSFIDLVTPRTKGQAISQNLIDKSDIFIDLVTPTGEVLNRKAKSLSQNLVGTFSNSSEEVAFVDSSLSTLPKMKSEAQCSSDQVPVQFIQSKAIVSEASEEEVSPDDQLASHLRCLSIEDQFCKGIEDRQMETGTQVLSFDENRDEITLENDELQKFDKMIEEWQMLVMEMQCESSNIVAMQTMADEIKEDIEDIILDFDHLAAVPW